MIRLLRPAALSLTLASALAAPAAAQIPDEFTNLEVLPADISQRQLIGVMRSFAGGLGVRCTYCHVGEEGRPFSEFDFASDEKPAKLKARYMLQMTQTLNDEVLPGLVEVAGRADPPARISCVTCHRGVAVPRQIEEVIAQAIADEGAEAGVRRYRELRERYYGSGSYDFGEQPLIEIAGGIARENPTGALHLYALALELYPESVQALVGSAQAHQANGDVAAARTALLRAQELAPDNPQIARMLERLEDPI